MPKASPSASRWTRLTPCSWWLTGASSRGFSTTWCPMPSATPPPGGRILLVATESGGEVVLSVHNTGDVIPVADREKNLRQIPAGRNRDPPHVRLGPGPVLLPSGCRGPQRPHCVEDVVGWPTSFVIRLPLPAIRHPRSRGQSCTVLHQPASNLRDISSRHAPPTHIKEMHMRPLPLLAPAVFLGSVARPGPGQHLGHRPRPLDRGIQCPPRDGHHRQGSVPEGQRHGGSGRKGSQPSPPWR